MREKERELGQTEKNRTSFLAAGERQREREVKFGRV